MTRLMCSKNRAEVETLKSELFRAGIRAQVRSNALADALGVSRVELWVEDERDMLKATKIYTGIQEQGNGGSRNSNSEPAAPPEEPPASKRGRAPAAAPPPEDETAAPGSALEQASLLLEKEIEDLLEREAELTRNSETLEAKIGELNQALGVAQGQLAREIETRTAVEKKRSAEVASLESTVERQQADVARLTEQLERERRELQQQVKSREESLKQTQRNLDTKAQQLQSQQSAVLELRKEVVAREQERDENAKLLAKARAELTMERENRVAAEARAENALASQRALEKELADQKDAQQRMEACVAGLNSLRARLQSKRGTKLEVD